MCKHPSPGGQTRETKWAFVCSPGQRVPVEASSLLAPLSASLCTVEDPTYACGHASTKPYLSKELPLGRPFSDPVTIRTRAGKEVQALEEDPFGHGIPLSQEWVCGLGT